MTYEERLEFIFNIKDISDEERAKLLKKVNEIERDKEQKVDNRREKINELEEERRNKMNEIAIEQRKKLNEFNNDQNKLTEEEKQEKRNEINDEFVKQRQELNADYDKKIKEVNQEYYKTTDSYKKQEQRKQEQKDRLKEYEHNGRIEELSGILRNVQNKNGDFPYADISSMSYYEMESIYSMLSEEDIKKARERFVEQREKQKDEQQAQVVKQEEQNEQTNQSEQEEQNEESKQQEQNAGEEEQINEEERGKEFLKPEGNKFVKKISEASASLKEKITKNAGKTILIAGLAITAVAVALAHPAALVGLGALYAANEFKKGKKM